MIIYIIIMYMYIDNAIDLGKMRFQSLERSFHIFRHSKNALFEAAGRRARTASGPSCLRVSSSKGKASPHAPPVRSRQGHPVGHSKTVTVAATYRPSRK